MSYQMAKILKYPDAFLKDVTMIRVFESKPGSDALKSEKITLAELDLWGLTVVCSPKEDWLLLKKEDLKDG